MKALSYKIIYDTGLAPNPFGKYCTLALCTPNHGIAARLKIGDWIIGHKGVNSKYPDYSLVYAMEITEPVLSLDEYYSDKRFNYKKPDKNGTEKQKAGDNMYYLENGELIQDPKAYYHTDKEDKVKDIRGNRVFISDNFYYLGKEADSEFPNKYNSLVCKTRKFRYSSYEDEKTLIAFIKWLKENKDPKMNAEPLSFKSKNDSGSC